MKPTTNHTMKSFISISVDGVWAGNGYYDGSIGDCAAVLGGSQDESDEIYALIEDAISEMDEPVDGSLEINGSTYAWTLTAQ